MKIFVAIPVYDGKLGIESVRCLLNEQAIAIMLGDELTVNFLSSDAGIAGARNLLAQDFMDSGFDRLVFLDSDVTCEPGAIVKLAHMPVDFVGGAYRHKQSLESYPIDWKQGELWSDENGLLEVAKIPTGFMALSRKVFETIREAHPDRTYTHFDRKGFCYFQIPFKDGVFYGEDYFFCHEWVELGGKIYLDPEINLTHWGFNPTPHPGHIGNWLKNRNSQQEPQT